MIIREKLYQQFGPLLIEALVLVIKNEINILRASAGLPERTNEQILIALSNKLSSLSKYEWMNE